MRTAGSNCGPQALVSGVDSGHGVGRDRIFVGLYHLVAGGEASWYAYARLVIEWACANGRPIKVAPEAIRPIPTTAYPTPAARPLNSRLSTAMLQQAFGLRLPAWEEGVERMLQELG